ncbi:MAG: LysR family transcriptional regulator [Gammaproteobacteria bacterium]|nr:LysR family transcriptional regulator [Gammaproteobacteria bacterium]
MDILNLQTFISVSDTQSFSRASEQLHITQPAVSKRISALEQTLGVRLFDRIGKKVQLTEAGEALLPSARRILAELEESRRAISNLSGTVSGKLKLGTSHHIGLHRLPPVLRRYTAKYPNVDLDIEFMDSEEACEGVLKGELELAIATLPEQTTTNLSTEIIWHDPLSIMVSRDHSLTSKKSISIADVIKHPAILPSTGTFTRALLEQVPGLDTERLHIAMETNYLETIKMMVSIGLGWSVLPLAMKSADLAVLDIDNFTMERQLGMAYHSERTLSNAARMMLQLLAEHREI